MTSSATLRTKRKPRSPRPKSASIAVKRVYEDASPDDGMRILVDRLWPRGLSKASLRYDLWPRQLTPSNELRKWYGHDPKRAVEFRRRYLDELAAHRDELAALREKIKGRRATLLTATHSLELSHVAVLRDVLQAKRARQRLSSKA
jgi:uncharacterized protein YeaO (DUF488 family)